MKSFRKHRKEFLYPDIEYPISFTIDNIFNGEIWKKSSSEIDNKKTMPLWSLLFKLEVSASIIKKKKTQSFE